MSNRFNVTAARPKKDGSVFFHRIGVAFENDKGGKKSISVEFDSLPIPDKEGKVRVILFPADDDRGQGGQGSGGQGGQGGQAAARAAVGTTIEDDALPF